MLKISYLFYIITAIFGNSFLKLNINGINSFYIYIFIGLMYYFYHSFIKQNEFEESSQYHFFKKFVVFYTILTLSYIILSYIGLVNVFNIEGFGYNKNFILRQAYFIFTLPIGISIVYDIFLKDFFDLIKLRNVLILFFMLILTNFAYGIDRVPYSSLLLSISTYVYFVKRKFKGIICIAITILVLGFGFSTYKIMYIIILFSIFDLKLIKVFFKKYFGIIVYFAILTMAVMTFLLYEDIVQFLYKDPNAIWRWQYWVHEAKVLINTYFLGVGFGTPYASNTIFSEIYNPSAFIPRNDYLGYSFEDVLYLTAQHNSFVNMFYRMGVIGGTLFLMINLVPISWFYKIYYFVDSKQRGILQWGFVNFLISISVILFNPGVESPRFFIPYLISFSVFLGLLNKYSKFNLSLKNENFVSS